ncbi:hypothetical protein HPB48_026394 [Haemaphysalis longicornis]|uniref:Transposable element P transposase-like RNase H C-terminal domain-containing protein n=1 Tax=Haemaphysalis longicornis TaxID=44386 RepID=A0A9J6H9K1_HAELO|nr:hypothetical protein HPB48_026394 [Haemaphysalis longicornis]
MTSRHPREALKPNSSSTTALSGFLEYLDSWEQHAEKDGGFLSQSTAIGLRVTISSTLELLSYLTSLGYSYLMTSRLCQDPLENMFGIVRQASGCNDHPTPTQFLITMNCISFYSLVKTVRYGNADPCALSALLDTQQSRTSCPPSNNLWEQVDVLIASGNLPEAEVVLSSMEHDQHIQRSDSRLIYYVAGYVARKCVMKTNCQDCMDALTGSSEDENPGLAALTLHRDRGGLLYPRGTLFSFVKTLEDMFTEHFSKKELHADSILDVLSLVKAKCTRQIGCSEHSTRLTKDVISFYITTRLHFFAKGINSEKLDKRKSVTHRKIAKT